MPVFGSTSRPLPSWTTSIGRWTLPEDIRIADDNQRWAGHSGADRHFAARGTYVGLGSSLS